ncbi:hypothetical protein D2V93_10435 [Flagellimonas taeanensis]|nr:hypothetical protein D2V93_10435 [Allomuricauda taeanensis]
MTIKIFIHQFKWPIRQLKTDIYQFTGTSLTKINILLYISEPILTKTENCFAIPILCHKLNLDGITKKCNNYENNEF